MANGEVEMDEKFQPRLRGDANKHHNPDSYDDIHSDFPPALFSHLERHLPPELLNQPRDVKLQYLMRIVSSHSSQQEMKTTAWQKEYRDSIQKSYRPMIRELYSLNPEEFFVQSFLDAIKENTIEGFHKILTEEIPGLFTFEIFQKSFCEKLMKEVENFEKWIDTTDLHIVRPNTMNKYGVVLDDFGFESMLDGLMLKFLKPLASVMFPDVGGASLDMHHGFIVEYSLDKDHDLGFHVDDSEVTLNVCLGKQFKGGDLFFRGTRCDKHVNSQAHEEECFDYSHVPGLAVLHAGRHRHGVKPISSGYRMNLILWCRSSTFRELKKHQRNFFRWCGECVHEKKKQQQLLCEARCQDTLQE